MATILVFGDSNSHGTLPLTELGVFDRYPRGQRWPDVMAEALGPAHAVIAEGLPGRTTVHDDPIDGGVRSGLAVLPAILHSHRPIDLLVILLGTNDLKPRFGVTAFEIARAVERLGQMARAEGPAVVADLMLVAPVPVRETGVLAETFAGAESRQVGLAGHLKAAAGRLGAGFVEAGLTVAVSPIDGVHWEADAHRAFGAVMAEAVSARLASAGGG
jgi:lysophospholipase L1-like esterase